MRKLQFKRIRRRIAAIICATAMLFSAVPANAFAMQEETTPEEAEETTPEEAEETTPEEAEETTPEEAEETTPEEAEETTSGDTEETTPEEAEKTSSGDTAEENTPGETEESASENPEENATEDTTEDMQENEYDFVSGYHSLPEEEEVSVVNEELAVQVGDVPCLLAEQEIPEKYVPGSYMPLTRNQNPYGTCWAHSCVAMAEIDMTKNHGASDPNYSELHLAYFSYNSVTDPLGGTEGDSNWAVGVENVTSQSLYNRGGNLLLAQNVLTSWTGLTEEDKAPYSMVLDNKDVTLESSLAFQDIVHLQNYYNVAYKENVTLAKEMIIEYGAMGVSYCQNSSYYDSANNSYYCDTASATNHAVTVVGWDDNFSKDNFNSGKEGRQPEENGAWLIRNSWVADMAYSEETKSNKSYFWISYYDKSLSTAGYVFDFESADNYDNNYQYDGGMYSSSIGYKKGLGLVAANVFTAKSCEQGETLESVGVLFRTAQTPYTIKIYLNPKDSSNPESGTLARYAITSGVSSCEGFYTIPLRDTVALEPGDTFAVVVECQDSLNGEAVYIGTERSSEQSFFGTQVSAKDGQSFLKPYGYPTWSDYGKSYGRNIRIKAYTKNRTGGEENVIAPESLEFAEDTPAVVSLMPEEKYQIEAYVLPRGTMDKELLYTSSDETVAVVDEDGMICAKTDGKATITVSLKNYPLIKNSLEVEVDGSLQAIKIVDGFLGDPVTTLTVGQLQSYAVCYTPENTTDDRTVTWSTSDPSIAEVHANGQLEAKSVGFVYLQAKVGAITDRLKIKCDFTEPSGPTVHYEQDENAATLLFDKVNGVDRYEILRRCATEQDDAFTVIGVVEQTEEDEEGLIESLTMALAEADNDDTANMLSYKDTSLLHGNTYEYRIRVVRERTFEEETTVFSKESRTVYITTPYKIVYHYDGAEEITANPKYYEPGSQFVLIHPEKEGYAFEGWYLDKDYQNRMESIDSDTRGNLELYAKWNKYVLSVIYHMNGGTNADANKEQFVELTSDFMLSDPLTEESGYEFGGWFEDESLETKITKIATGTTGEKHLYAKWVPQEYRIEFCVNAPSDALVSGEMEEQIYRYGECKELLRNRYKVEGYTFLGWTDRPDNANGILFGDGAAAAPLLNRVEGDCYKLYAVWSNGLKVYFETNGGSLAITAIKYMCNQKVTLPTPTRTGYTFAGWYSDAAYSSKRINKLAVKQAGEMTVFAKWTPNNYTVVFDGNGSKQGKQSKMTVQYTDASKQAPQCKFVKKGYEFVGWSTDPLGGDNAVRYSEGETIDLSVLAERNLLPEKNKRTVKLYAQWKTTSYHITYELNGGVLANAPDSYEYGKGMTLPTPTRTGFYFAGWYSNPNCSKAVKEIKKVAYGDVTLYAKWAADYTIEFYDTNPVSSIINGTCVKTQKMKYEQAKAIVKNSIKYTGYHFEGWADSVEKAEQKNVVYKDREKVFMPTQLETDGQGNKVLKLYAVWNNEYKIHFVTNDHEGNEQEAVYYYGQGIGKSALADMIPLQKEGYRFAGWYKDAKLTKKVTFIGPKIAEDLVLYGKWTGESYQLLFDSNAPKGQAIKGRMNKQKSVVGKKGSIRKNQFKTEYYEFAGWAYTKEHAAAKTVDLSDGASFTDISQYPQNGQLTLYAVWIPKTYHIIYENMKGGVEHNNPLTYTTETDTITLSNPVKRGYIFRGWYLDKELTSRIYAIEKGSTGDWVLYAKWEENKK